MLGLFSKKSKLEKLEKKYARLIEDAYKLSHSNRRASDDKSAEADQVMTQIEVLRTSQSMS